MPLIVRAFPVLRGKEEDVRKLAAEMAGRRRKEAQEFYRSFGVVRESWHFQETPHGPLLIGVTEVDGELGARAQNTPSPTVPSTAGSRTRSRTCRASIPTSNPWVRRLR